MMSEVEFSATAVFGFMTGLPLVDCRFGSWKAQISPAEARAIAMLLLECAEAAESDATLVHVLTEMGMDREGAARMLLAMRTKRAEMGESHADDHREG